MISKRQLGTSGELTARRRLEALGYGFLAANYSTRYGELDLVMRDAEELVFVEVKARRRKETGHPAEAATPRKLGHTVRAAEAYRIEHGMTGPWRIDVYAIGPDGERHYRNVTG